MMTVGEIEAHVADNLRNAFSVIGLLQEEHSFYNMITDRIAYVTMDLILNVTGSSHATKTTDDKNLAYKKLFGTDEGFWDSIRNEVQVFAPLERIYRANVFYPFLFF